VLKVFARILGATLALVAALVLFLSIVALIDPVGTKMADDNDPFGTLDPWYVPAGMAVGSLGVVGAGLWLLVRRSKPGHGAC